MTPRRRQLPKVRIHGRLGHPDKADAAEPPATPLLELIDVDRSGFVEWQDEFIGRQSDEIKEGAILCVGEFVDLTRGDLGEVDPRFCIVREHVDRCTSIQFLSYVAANPYRIPAGRVIQIVGESLISSSVCGY